MDNNLKTNQRQQSFEMAENLDEHIRKSIETSPRRQSFGIAAKNNDQDLEIKNLDMSPNLDL